MDNYQRFRWAEERQIIKEENLAQAPLQVLEVILATGACFAFVWGLHLIFT